MEKDHITNEGLSSPYDKGREYLQQQSQPPIELFYGPPPGLNLNHQHQQQYHHLSNNNNGNQNQFLFNNSSGPGSGYYYPNMNSYNMIHQQQQQQQHQVINPNNVDGSDVFSYTSAVEMQNSHLFNNLSSSGSDINSGSSMQNNFYPTSSAMTTPNISQSQYVYNNGNNNKEFEMRKGMSSYLSSNAPTFIPLQQQQQEYLYQQHKFDEQQKLVAKRTNSEPPMQKKNSTDDVNVIEPLIENIVGSISNTYTHFGNSGVGVLKNLANNINNKNSTSSDNIAFILEQQRINHIAIQQQQQQQLQQQLGTNSSSVNNRSSTPKDFIENNSSNNSRPQTPKLSYLEVLTKNGSVKSSTNSTTASNNDTPNPINNSSSSNSYRKSSASNFQESSPTITTFASAVQFTNRKPGDLTTQSSSSSNPSESSSPATKPKSYNNNTNQSFYHQQQQYKGNKENNSNSNSKPSSGKNTPNSSTTPVHQIHYNNKVNNKGASSSYLSGGCNNDEYVSNNGFSMVIKGGKGRKIHLPSQDQQIGATNHFDIEDFDENESLDSSKSSASGVKSASKRKLLINGKENSTNGDKDRKTSEKSFSGGKKGGNATKGEKVRNSKFRGQNCVLRKIQTITNFSFSYIKLHLISFLTWLWVLVSDVIVLSCSLGLTLFGDFCTWWSSMLVPLCRVKLRTGKKQIHKLWEKVKGWTVYLKWKRKAPTKNEENQDGIGGIGGDRNYPDDEAAKLLSLLGPDKNIQLPSTGEEALKRLLSVKGQDPYSILGVRSNCSDETIRRYYKNQCRLVHPDKNCIVGAEEAFKILARAFDMIGEPLKRQEYNRQLFESKCKEKVFGEIGNLLEQLRKKMESVTNTIRCTKCQKRHQKIRTDRQLYAARYCSQCRIFHSAREGDLWAEKKGFFGLSWHYYACMECSVWQINEWAKCQKKNLVHLKSDSHNVMYRLVAGAQNQQNQQNCGGEGGPEETLEHDNEDWDSIINNIYTNTNPTSKTGGVKTQNGNVNNATGGVDGSRKRRGKRK